MALIELRQVDKIYHLGETQVTALKQLSLTIQAGEFVAVSGPSGSGKSTLCNLIGAIDRPTNGTIQLNGVDLASLSDDALSTHRNESIGFIFQNFNLVNVLDAVENVMLPLQVRGEDPRKARHAATALLCELGLDKHLRHRPDHLSGGQRQRVAIARALVTRPPMVVADEPTANLDTENAERVLELMLQYHRAWNTTFVFSTHDPRLIQKVQRCVTLRDGCIKSDQKTTEADTSTSC